MLFLNNKKSGYRFVPLGGRRPVGWKQAVRIAGWVQVDEMRTLLELHPHPQMTPFDTTAMNRAMQEP